MALIAATLLDPITACITFLALKRIKAGWHLTYPVMLTSNLARKWTVYAQSEGECARPLALSMKNNL